MRRPEWCLGRRAGGRWSGRTLLSLLTPASLFLLAHPVAAQDPLSRAFDLERRGSFAQAAEIYQGVLRKEPGEVTALLGLERSLTPINRLPELLPAVRGAIVANPTAAPIYSIGLRAYSAANLPDSLPHLVDLWARAVPGDEAGFIAATAALAVAPCSLQPMRDAAVAAARRATWDEVLARFESRLLETVHAPEASPARVPVVA